MKKKKNRIDCIGREELKSFQKKKKKDGCANKQTVKIKNFIVLKTNSLFLVPFPPTKMGIWLVRNRFLSPVSNKRVHPSTQNGIPSPFLALADFIAGWWATVVHCAAIAAVAISSSPPPQAPPPPVSPKFCISALAWSSSPPLPPFRRYATLPPWMVVVGHSWTSGAIYY